MSRSVSHLRAIGFALASYTFWVFTDTCMKLATEAGLPPYELMALMGLSAAIAMALRAAVLGETKKLQFSNWRHQLLCASCSVVCVLANGIALRHLSLNVFYVVVFTAPMTIVILAAVFLKEHLTPIKVAAVIAGFIGVLIAVYVPAPPTASSPNDWIGYVAATISVGAYSIWTIRMRGMTQSETLESIALFSCIALVVVGSLLTAINHSQATFAGAGMALIAGLINLCGNLTNYKALKHTTAGNVLQLHYTQIITGALLAYLIWHDVPTWNLTLGAVIIIASGLTMAAHAKRSEKLEASINL